MLRHCKAESLIHTVALSDERPTRSDSDATASPPILAASTVTECPAVVTMFVCEMELTDVVSELIERVKVHEGVDTIIAKPHTGNKAAAFTAKKESETQADACAEDWCIRPLGESDEVQSLDPRTVIDDDPVVGALVAVTDDSCATSKLIPSVRVVRIRFHPTVPTSDRLSARP